jgi:hypothetical protein
VTYYVLFFIHLGSRKIHVAGVTPHPNKAWMVQVARNMTMEEWGCLSPGQYLIHDRDGKYCPAFQQITAWYDRTLIGSRALSQLYPDSIGIMWSLNLSEFVVDRSWSVKRGVRRNEAPLFSRNWLENGEETCSSIASVYALQTAIN